jgi:dTDP-4-amino-4,6-dideoxygalactose transaminase
MTAQPVHGRRAKGRIKKLIWPKEFPGAHWLDASEEKAVADVLRRKALFRYYGLGKPKHVDTLEAAARQFYGVKYALGVNSGTGALFTAVRAFNLGPGDEVIVPAFFWVATVGAVVQANAIPVLCEVDDTFTMDPEDLDRKITSRTKLIIPVHMAGAVCNLRAIMAVARQHDVPVLEDCAQANGGEFRGRKVGTAGAIGMFSLQWNKNATAGEGGLVITNDRGLYERLVAAHDVGLPWVNGSPKETGPAAITWGGGRRMSELTGAVAAVQLKKLPRIIKHMRDSKRRIKAALGETPGLSFRRLHDEAGDTGCFLILVLDNAEAAQKAVTLMKAGGLQSAARLPDYGMHIYYNLPQLVRKVPLSPAGNPWNLPQNGQSVYDYHLGACPRSDALFARSIILPIPSCLTQEQEQAAVTIIKSALAM